MTRERQSGFTLIEVLFAMGILVVGVLGAAAVLAKGMQNLSSSPADVVVAQKAAQAIEAVFAARDSHKLKWDEIRNVAGGTGSDNGVFVDGPTPLAEPGPDGLVNTADDLSTVEQHVYPGKDQLLGTADDDVVPLVGYTREIEIREVAGGNGQLRSVVVTITYPSGGGERTYTLTTFISAYA